MNKSTNGPYSGLSALLRPEDSIVVLIDHQPAQFTDLHSHEPALVVNAVVGLARAAKAFGVPTILTTVVEDNSGKIIQPLQEVYPEQIPINRTTINSWEDRRVAEAVRSTGRKQLIMAGLWTEVCLAMPAIQAAGEGYEVFAVTDASGGKSRESHDMAVLRMIQAGVRPITWMAVGSEWQRDWARTATLAPFQQAVMPFAGGVGLAIAWEMQLLNSGGKGLAPPTAQPGA